jgi:putative sigma-54 modulation protein
MIELPLEPVSAGSFSVRGVGDLGTRDIRTYVRARGIELGHEDRASLRRKIATKKLGKFGGSIERISVRLEDVNGPRGGIDHVCRIKVVLAGLPSVVIERRGRSLEAVAAGTLAGVERAIRRRLQRRRMAPLKKRSSAG